MDVAKQKKAQLAKQEKEIRTTMVVSKAKSEFKSLGDGKCASKLILMSIVAILI